MRSPLDVPSVRVCVRMCVHGSPMFSIQGPLINGCQALLQEPSQGQGITPSAQPS